MSKFKTLAVLVVAVSMMLTGVVLAMSHGKYSGFMEDYPTFEADKDRKGAKIYHKPGVSLKNYTKIAIAPIEIWIAADSKYKGIDPNDLKALADTFRAAIVAELEPAYPVVSKPGEGVLVLRIAITDVFTKKKKRGLLGYTPVGFVAKGVKDLTVGPAVSLADAVIEAELIDSQTNERIGALIDRQSASMEKRKDTSWEKIQSTLTFYAKRFRGRMDTEHGK
jgi:hypothetical protein